MSANQNVTSYSKKQKNKTHKEEKNPPPVYLKSYANKLEIFLKTQNKLLEMKTAKYVVKNKLG